MAMREILTWMNINGIDVKREQACIPATDLGVLNGYGVFTTLKIKQGIPIFWEYHWRRLQNSLSRLGFSHLSLSFDLKEAVFSVIQKNTLINAAIRVTFTAGQQSVLSPEECTTPTVIVSATLNSELPTFLDAITVPEQRDSLRDLKMTYRVINLLVEQQAKLNGTHIALFTEEGKIVESTRSNVFSIDAHGKFITPPIEGKGLNGICRQIILENGYGEVGDIFIETSGPLFLVNSLSITQVRYLNGKKLIQQTDRLIALRRFMEDLEDKYIEN